MKANKVLKRLAKIEALLSDVTERCSKSGAPVKQALQDAKAAFAKAKAAVSSQVSAKTEKNPQDATAEKKVPVKKKVVKTTAVAAAPAVVKKKIRRVSPAARERQAERMKALWLAKKKAQAESQAAASEAMGTVPPAVETPAPSQADEQPAVPQAALATAD